MKSIRTVREIREGTYGGTETPQYKIGDWVRVYCGRNQDHNFKIADVRFNHDVGKFEYLYDGLMGGWYQEGSIVAAGDRRGWHYDSLGYCDNPGRGY